MNAAQVWRYFTVYSETANRLPGLPPLQEELNIAVSVFRKAILQSEESPDNDVDKFVQASILFKNFLQESLALGQRVWTRFDTFGMVGGISVLTLGMIVYVWPLVQDVVFRRTTAWYLPLSQTTEVALAAVFMLFLCGLLTFSNSYILEEENCIMYGLAVLSAAIALRIRATTSPETSIAWKMMLVLPILSRVAELFISGHGLDPSIVLHGTHHSVVFLTSLGLLGVLRWSFYRFGIIDSLAHLVTDLLTFFFLALSWWEKRAPDVERTGYTYSRTALLLLFLSLGVALGTALVRPKGEESLQTTLLRTADRDVSTVLIKVLIAIMTVTGPSAAPSLVILTFQVIILYMLSASMQFQTLASTRTSPMVVSSLLRLVTRHGEYPHYPGKCRSGVLTKASCSSLCSLLCHEPWMCFQPSTIISCVHCHLRVLLRSWRHFPVSQYFWLGDGGHHVSLDSEST